MQMNLVWLTLHLPQALSALHLCLGTKESKNQLTFLICTNFHGLENIPPLMVGRGCRPRCFGEIDAKEFGIDYYVGGKGWMNASIFHRWLQRFDTYVSRTPGRRALLFIDNAPVHWNIYNIPQLQNLHVEFLSKRTTAILQPLDIGVIASIKKRYKHKVAQRAVDLIDAGHSEGLHRIDLKLAGLWVYDIWERIQNDIVYNCWLKSTIVYFNYQ